MMTRHGEGKGGMRNELAGVRGLQPYKALRYRLTHFIGRAFWFDHLSASIEYAMARHRERGRPLAYYEFGTGSGNTLQRAISVLKGFPESRIVLFDSFQGLPATDNPKDKSRDWNKGAFAYPEHYIQQLIENSGVSMHRVRFVKGFFEHSLTPALAASLGDVPPSFVTVDVDYYSSTKTVLEFLRPMLWSGSTFYFDDLWSFDGHPEYGQLCAVNEFNGAPTARGQLVPNPVFQNRIYTYYNRDYEFLR
jgi:hypothetical protein